MTLTRNWGISLVQELEAIGRVSVFDWENHGVSESDPRLQELVPRLNEEMIRFASQRHREDPLDWILVTCSGDVILRSTIRYLREELGVPVVNLWLDCNQTFIMGVGPHGQDLGQVDIAPEFDIVWTNARSVCEWYLAVGAKPLYLPPGFSPTLTPKLDLAKEWEVGFLGARYALRPDRIQYLRAAGVNVEVRGRGWGQGSELDRDEMGAFFARSRVSLGMGEVGYSQRLMTLKGRDFEVPGAGGTYVTTYHGDLEDHYQIGKHILCYRSDEELLHIVRLLLDDPAQRAELAEQAYAHSMAHHRWSNRFRHVLGVMGLDQSDDTR